MFQLDFFSERVTLLQSDFITFCGLYFFLESGGSVGEHFTLNSKIKGLNPVADFGRKKITKNFLFLETSPFWQKSIN
jgi:hypothetical protein